MFQTRRAVPSGANFVLHSVLVVCFRRPYLHFCGVVTYFLWLSHFTFRLPFVCFCGVVTYFLRLSHFTFRLPYVRDILSSVIPFFVFRLSICLFYGVMPYILYRFRLTPDYAPIPIAFFFTPLPTDFFPIWLSPPPQHPSYHSLDFCPTFTLHYFDQNLANVENHFFCNFPCILVIS